MKTFKLNFSGVPVYHGDIHKLTVEQCLQMTGLQVGELDVLDGSPPCQGFSTAGKRVMTDKRNQLYMEFVRLLRGLRPRVFIMENVSGLIKGKMKLIFADIMREMKASGYRVRCKLLNAMYFHVPQSRQRLIFIGAREDLGTEPSYPEAEAKPITVRESWAYPVQGRDDAVKMSPKFQGYWYAAGEGGSMGKFDSSRRARLNYPAKTLSKSEGYGGIYHPTEPRPLHTWERMRLASFPDSFIFMDWENAVSQIGNSVPPLFMRAIARHVYQQS